MQHVRIFLAWLPSEIFPKYGNFVEWEKTIANIFQRATKCGKFSLAAWQFDVVLNSRHLLEVPEQKLSQIYDIASIFTHFCAHVRQLQKCSIDKKFGDLIVHWSINVQKKFFKNLSTNFVLIAVSVKVALTQYHNTVRKFCNIANYRAKIDETPIDLHRFMNGHVYFKLYLSRVFVYLKHVCTGNQPLTLR